MTSRRSFLRSLALGAAILQLRFRPEAAPEVKVEEGYVIGVDLAFGHDKYALVYSNDGGRTWWDVDLVPFCGDGAQ